MATRDKYVKAIVVGEQGVGVTSFIRRYAEGVFPTFISKVEGLDYRLKEIKNKGVSVRIQVWDKVCNQRSRYVYESYTSCTDVAYLLYDTTNKKSFLELELWLSQVKDVPVKIIIGTKCDLKTKREVSTTEAETLAKSHGVEFLEVSAKEGTNMDLIMDSFCLNI